MRSSLVLLAALAGSTLALPTASTAELDARTFGLVGGLIDSIKDILHGTSPVNILGGISAEAAVALNGGAIGCKAGSIDFEYRKQLSIWLKTGAGAHIDASLKKSLLAWCEADVSVDLEIDLEIRAQLSFFLPALAHIAAQKELYVTLEGVFDFAKEVAGVLTIGAQASLEAAIALLGELDWKIKAGLEFCAAGGVLADLDVEIIAALKLWLESKECKLDVHLKKTIKFWLEGKIEGDVIELPKIPVDGLTTISLGKSLEVLIEASGALVASAQASLYAFLKTDIGLEIDIEIKKIIEFCAKGGLAIDIEYEKRVELSLWLASSKCKLTAELKSLLAFWLSFGVSAGAEVSVDFSKNILAEIEVLLGKHFHGLLSFLFSGEGVLSISIEARAQLAALIGGGFGFSIDKHIEIIIIGWLGGCHECCGGKPPVSSTTTPTLPTTTPTPSPSTTTTKTTTTTTATTTEPEETPCETDTDVEPTPTSTTTKPTEPEETPCETDTDVEPTTTPTTTPSEPEETPCETDTDVEPTATPTTTPSESEETPCETETDVEPTATPTTTKPTEPEETPCETDTDVEPTATPTTTNPTEPEETPCETDTDVEPTATPTTTKPTEPEETPCETDTDVEPTATPTTTKPTKPTEPEETPCETDTDVEPTGKPTETKPPVPTDVEPTEPATQPPSTITNPPVPTTTSTGGQKTVTITKTVGVEYCPPNW
ncbi:hypothetical protein BJX63DRAFT_184549 [Aspergillus granulosus]|uniref:Cell wall protein n=1 Tax=Aspergillus granulosus TaxID=176169 RepID=A0ABR4HHX7_9EURO